MWSELSDSGARERVVLLVGRALERRAAGAAAADGAQCTLRLEGFHSQVVPSLSLPAYLSRIARYAPRLDLHVFLILARVASATTTSTNSPPLVVCPRCVHRFVLAAVLFIAKLTQDNFYSNAHLAKIGGLLTDQLNALERALLASDLTFHCDPLLLLDTYRDLLRDDPDCPFAPVNSDETPSISRSTSLQEIL